MAQRVSGFLAPILIFLLANSVGGAPMGYEVDFTPPSVLSSTPREDGVLTTNDFILSINTDESSQCRFGFEDTGFSFLPYLFPQTGTSHILNMSLGEGAYSIYVRCRDLYGTGGNEMKEPHAISFTIDTNPPFPIDDISIGKYEDRVFLTWTPPFDAGSGVAVQMLYRKSNGAEYVNIMNLSPSANTYVDTSAASGIEYTYQILSVDFAGHEQARGASVSTGAIPPAPITAQLFGASASLGIVIVGALLLVFFGSMFIARRILG